MSQTGMLTSRRHFITYSGHLSSFLLCFQHGWELHSKHCRWSRTEVTKYGKQQGPRFRTSGRNSVNIYNLTERKNHAELITHFTLWERESRTNKSKSTYLFVLCTPMDSFGCQCMERATHMRIVQTPCALWTTNTPTATQTPFKLKPQTRSGDLTPNFLLTNFQPQYCLLWIWLQHIVFTFLPAKKNKLTCNRTLQTLGVNSFNFYFEKN